jgi:N-acetyl-alpha-D-muramate 1-phosphate uridylyltransferase
MNHKKERLKAMILAAGRGARMRPLTDNLPKPLLCVGNKTLIEYHIENLARAGFVDIVINHAYLGKMIETALGDGSRYGVNIYYSPETIALETAGGIVKALPLLESKSENELVEQPFLIVNADIYCEFNFSTLLPTLRQIKMGTDTAHLVMVSNQEHHPDGDFFLDSGRLVPTGKEKLTFSGISIYKTSFFYGIKPGIVSKLAPKLCQAITEGKVSGEHYKGVWVDVGTPERLHRLDVQLRNK